VSRAFARAQHRAELVQESGAWHWIDTSLDLSTPLHRIARAAVGLLTATPPLTVTECADEACGWLFADTSRRRNRVWCTAAGCGDRNRARRYYRRHVGDDEGTDRPRPDPSAIGTPQTRH
jgi:predicted RNA-binding Zn ribbon-like protein